MNQPYHRHLLFDFCAWNRPKVSYEPQTRQLRSTTKEDGYDIVCEYIAYIYIYCKILLKKG